MRGRASLALAVVLCVGVARAQTRPDDDLIDQGIALRRANRVTEALQIFQRVWERSRSPRARAQMGFVEHEVGLWYEAESHLAEALEFRDDPWIRRRRSLLEGALADVRDHFGRLELRGGVAGSEVFLNTRAAGVLPQTEPLQVLAGDVAVEVRCPGYLPFRRTVVVRRRELSRETVEMVAEPAPPPPPPPSPRPVPVEPPPPALPPVPRVTPTAPPPSTAANMPEDITPPVAPPPTARSPVSRSSGVAVAGRVLFAVGAVLLAGGVVAWVATRAPAEQYLRDVQYWGCRGDDLVEVDAGCIHDRDAARLGRAFTLTGYIGGGALAGLGAILWLAAPSSASANAQTSLRCGPGPGDLGIACGARF